MARAKSMYPAPVYHATLDDGRTVRMTVWQAKDAPVKGFDWQICRNTILNLSSGAGYEAAFTMIADARINAYLDDCYRTSGPTTFVQPKSNLNAGRKIISAHIEQEGEVLADDPLCEVKPVKKRTRVAMGTIATSLARECERLAHDLDNGRDRGELARALRAFASTAGLISVQQAA